MKTHKAKNPNKTYACEDCTYYSNYHCKLWEVKISEPDNSHCESLQIANFATGQSLIIKKPPNAYPGKYMASETLPNSY